MQVSVAAAVSSLEVWELQRKALEQEAVGKHARKAASAEFETNLKLKTFFLSFFCTEIQTNFVIDLNSLKLITLFYFGCWWAVV